MPLIKTRQQVLDSVLKAIYPKQEKMLKALSKALDAERDKAMNEHIFYIKRLRAHNNELRAKVAELEAKNKPVTSGNNAVF